MVKEMCPSPSEQVLRNSIHPSKHPSGKVLQKSFTASFPKLKEQY